MILAELAMATLARRMAMDRITITSGCWLCRVRASSLAVHKGPYCRDVEREVHKYLIAEAALRGLYELAYKPMFSATRPSRT